MSNTTDNRAEGYGTAFGPGMFSRGFPAFWREIGGDWDANPWVWVIEFRRIGE